MSIAPTSAPRCPVAPPRRFALDRATAGFSLFRQQVEAIGRARSGRHSLLAVTLRPGREVHGEADEIDLWRIVREWDRSVCCRSLGFNHRNLHQTQRYRPIHVLLAQHGETTWHYHGVASVLDHQLSAYITAAPLHWSHHSPGGDTDIQPMRGVGWLEYATRKLRDGGPMLFRMMPEKGIPAPAPLPLPAVH